MSKSVIVAALVAFTPAVAQADTCDYKPSSLFDLAAETAETGTLAAADTVGGYTLLNTKSGTSLLGRAVEGRSVKDAVGAASGAGGFVSALSSIAAAPATLIAGAVTAVAVGGYEGVCYFSVERVTETDKVVAILEEMERNANPDYFWIETPEGADGPSLYLRDLEDANKLDTYEVSRLYIGDGMLRHRDLGLNTVVGKVIYLEAEPDEPAAE